MNAPAVTDEQRAAWLDMRGMATPGTQLRTRLDLIAPLLPSELTNPQPVLPTEHGWYQDRLGDVWRFDEAGIGYPTYQDGGARDARPFAPFTRLVPERPQITRDQIESACTEARADRPNPPQVYAILALVNGADQ